MSPNVSKKFYRHVVRGVNFYSQEKKRACKLQELVAYVYLKNSRTLYVDVVEAIVKKALTDLCASGVIKKTRDRYYLDEQITGNRLVQHPSDKQVLADPSGSVKRRASSEKKRTAQSKKRSKARGGPVDGEGIDGLPVPEDVDPQEEEAEEDVDSEEEVFPHRPMKMEKEDFEDQQDPAATSSQSEGTPSPGENNPEQGSSPIEGSSA